MALDLRAQGLQAQEQGKYDLALFYFERASLLDAKNPELRNDRGLINEYLGNKNRAEEDYREAIKLDEGYLPSYYNLGCLYLNDGNYDLALEYLNKRVEKGMPGDEWTLKAQEKIEQVYGAVPYFREERTEGAAQEMEKNIVSMRQASKVIESKKRTVDFEIAYQRGVSLLEEKRYDDALLFLRKALAIRPQDASAALALKRAMYGKERVALEQRTAYLQKKNNRIPQVFDREVSRRDVVARNLEGVESWKKRAVQSFASDVAEKKNGETLALYGSVLRQKAVVSQSLDQAAAQEAGLTRYLDRVSEQRGRVSRSLDLYTTRM